MNGPATLRPLCLPLAGRSVPATADDAAQVIGVQACLGINFLMVNTAAGSSIAWCVYDELAPIRFFEARSAFLTHGEIVIAETLLGRRAR